MSFLKRFNFERSWSRFPLSSLTAVCAGILLIYMHETASDASVVKFGFCQKLLYALMMLFATSVFAAFWSYKNRETSVVKFILPIGFSLIYFLLLPSTITEYDFLKHISLLVFFLLLLAPWVFNFKDEEQSFWGFFVTHLALIVETLAFSAFVYGSISMAILALEKLFGFSFGEINIYINLFILVASIFFPTYFLSRATLPTEDFSKTNHNKVLQIFASKILLPIVFLYALILAAYFLKILFEGAWPRGWVSNLILWFSAFAIPAFFINKYLFEAEQKGKLLRLFEKYFFYFLLLCSIVLAMAVQLRTSEYGITENRYVVIMVAIWLFVISVYNIVFSKKDLRFLPLSLAFFVLISFFGPLSIFEIPIQSQFKRLKASLADFDSKNKKQVASIAERLRFLDNRDAIDLVLAESAFSNITKDASDQSKVKPSTLFFYNSSYFNNRNPEALKSICETIGFDYGKVQFNSRTIGDRRFNFYTRKKPSIDITSYDDLIFLHGYNNKDNAQLSDDGTELIISDPESFRIPVAEIFNGKNQLDFPSGDHEPLHFQYETEAARYLFIFYSFNGHFENDYMQLEHYEGYMLVGRKIE